MTIIQKLGLVGLLAAAGCGFGGGETLVHRNPGVQVQNLCRDQPLAYSPTKKSGGMIEAEMMAIETNLPETLAIDTDGNGRYDEAFVVRDYINMNISGLQFDDVALKTTHYVALGIGPDKQYLTGFPDTKPMTPEYQALLGLACRGQ